ncbi:hypothetical protein D3C77_585190 [compost metagenome]
MHHGAELIEGDVTVGGNADGEHQLVGRRRTAFDHAAVERQVHRLISGRVGQPGSPGYHAQRIGQRAGAIGAKR